jgi:hypothetical protein
VTTRPIVALAALAVALVAARPPHGDAPRLELAAHGAARVVDSRHGRAIISAANMSPGQSVRGGVTISNRGRAHAQLALRSARPRGARGPRGGALGDALQVRIVELRRPGRPRRVAAGTARRVAGCHPLGRLAVGARRRFRFTVRFRRRGAVDNRYMRARALIAERWTLSERRPCRGRRHPARPR